MRRLIAAGALVIGLAGIVGCSGPSAAGGAFASAAMARAKPEPAGSVSNAYAFLHLMLDKYASDSTPRLVRSFDGGPLRGFTDAVTYDDALFIDALLARGSVDDIARSEIVGNAFLYVQAHDVAGDGRLRGAYAPKPLVNPSDVVVRDNTSDVGNMAWVGQALVRLYSKTSNTTYLDGATRIGRWLQVNTRDTRGSGGYTGGDAWNGKKITWKSTEHNIDVYALFTMLAQETHDSNWTSRAAWAKRFVASMWDPHAGRFYVGTGDDGVTPNRSFKPEDVNSWSYLAFANRAWARAPSWDVKYLAVSKGGFSGVSFCSGDLDGVWFEGTAHLADALELRGQTGDPAQAAAYLSDVEYAQTSGPNNDGRGIIAASISGLRDCDGDKYYASLHVGATAWYILASEHSNPFTLP